MDVLELSSEDFPENTDEQIDRALDCLRNTLKGPMFFGAIVMRGDNLVVRSRSIGTGEHIEIILHTTLENRKEAEEKHIRESN